MKKTYGIDKIDKIKEWLNDVQKKATTRTVHLLDIEYATETLEEHFKNVPKKYRKGIRVKYNHYASDYRGYGYVPVGTVVYLEWLCNEWRVVDIERKDCHGSQHFTVEKAPADILQHINKGIDEVANRLKKRKEDMFDEKHQDNILKKELKELCDRMIADGYTVEMLNGHWTGYRVMIDNHYFSFDSITSVRSFYNAYCWNIFGGK